MRHKFDVRKVDDSWRIYYTSKNKTSKNMSRAFRKLFKAFGYPNGVYTHWYYFNPYQKPYVEMSDWTYKNIFMKLCPQRLFYFDV